MVVRPLVALVCAGVFGSTAAVAQSPAPPGPAAPAPPPPEAASGWPSLDLPPLVPSDGGFYGEAELLLRWFKPVCAAVPVVAIGDPRAAVPGRSANRAPGSWSAGRRPTSSSSR